MATPTSLHKAAPRYEVFPGFLGGPKAVFSATHHFQSVWPTTALLIPLNHSLGTTNPLCATFVPFWTDSRPSRCIWARFMLAHLPIVFPSSLRPLTLLSANTYQTNIVLR